jgi:hypothetical protein
VFPDRQRHQERPRSAAQRGSHGILDNAVDFVDEPALVLTQVGNDSKHDDFLTMPKPAPTVE